MLQVALFTLLALVPLTSAARSLPNPMLGGYAGNGECDAAVVTAVQQGLNVIFWFSLDLSPSQPPSGGPNLTCVAEVKRNLTASGLATTHMISVGGWDAPHPVNGTAAEFYAQWKAWNEQGGEALFDGIDWDLEGNDNATSPWNTLALDSLAIVGGVSQLAKADGYLVTLVPPESYFDVSTPLFDRGLTHPYPEPWHPEFLYHGHNGYAYIYAKYGGPATFDAVSVQLYETFAHADYNISILHQRPADYLQAWVTALSAGWTVDFASAPELGFPSQHLALPPSQLVVGLANGWAGGAGAPRALLIMPEEVGVAWEALGEGRPRGAVFWCIGSEGAVPSGQSTPLYLAAGLNAFMGIR